MDLERIEYTSLHTTYIEENWVLSVKYRDVAYVYRQYYWVGFVVKIFERLGENVGAI